MSKIDDLVIKLLEKKLMIEALEGIAESASKVLEIDKYENVREKVTDLILNFVTSSIEDIENSVERESSPVAKVTEPSEEDMKLLLHLANEIKNKKSNIKNKKAKKLMVPPEEGQEVIFTNEDGDKQRGIIEQIKGSFSVIKTINGKVQILNEKLETI